MKTFKRFFVTTLITLLAFAANAQSTMEASFHANGSILVVVAVAAIVLIGIFVFIFYLERRLKKLEKKK